MTIDSCNDSCTKTGNVTATKGSIDYTITQSNCSSDCPTVYYYGSTIPTEGSPIGLPLMYWSPSDDYPLNTFSVSYTGDGITSTEFITSSSLLPGQTVNVLLVKFSANTGTSSRTFNVHLSTSVSSDCTWDNTYTQDGKSCTIAFTMSSGCSSGSEHINFKAYDVCTDYANDVVNWTITFNGNTYNGTSFGVQSSTGQSGIDESWENSDRNKVTGNATVNWSLSNHPSVTGQSIVTFGTCETPPSPVTIYLRGKNDYTGHVIKIIAIDIVFGTSGDDAYNFNPQWELPTSTFSEKIEKTIRADHEDVAITSIGLSYTVDGTHYSRALDSDEWETSSVNKLKSGDTLLIVIKR